MFCHPLKIAFLLGILLTYATMFPPWPSEWTWELCSVYRVISSLSKQAKPFIKWGIEKKKRRQGKGRFTCMLSAKLSERWCWKICLFGLTDKKCLFPTRPSIQILTACPHACSAVRRVRCPGSNIYGGTPLRLTLHLGSLCTSSQPAANRFCMDWAGDAHGWADTGIGETQGTRWLLNSRGFQALTPRLVLEKNALVALSPRSSLVSFD